RHAVIHEAAGDELPGLAVIDLVLQERLSQPLHHATVNLPAHDERVEHAAEVVDDEITIDRDRAGFGVHLQLAHMRAVGMAGRIGARSEEHTSELQSRRDLVCRLLLEKKKKKKKEVKIISRYKDTQD